MLFLSHVNNVMTDLCWGVMYTVQSEAFTGLYSVVMLSQLTESLQMNLDSN